MSRIDTPRLPNTAVRRRRSSPFPEPTPGRHTQNITNGHRHRQDVVPRSITALKRESAPFGTTFSMKIFLNSQDHMYKDRSQSKLKVSDKQDKTKDKLAQIERLTRLQSFQDHQLDEVLKKKDDIERLTTEIEEVLKKKDEIERLTIELNKVLESKSKASMAKIDAPKDNHSLANEVAHKVMGMGELLNTDPPEEQARELGQWQHEVEMMENGEDVVDKDCKRTAFEDIKLVHDHDKSHRVNLLDTCNSCTHEADVRKLSLVSSPKMIQMPELRDPSDLAIAPSDSTPWIGNSTPLRHKTHATPSICTHATPSIC